MSKTTPIVFFHRNWSWYLPYVLHQARAACPSSEVVLIGEVPVAGFSFVPLKRFEMSRGAVEFRRRYQHMATNPEENVVFWYLRWFYLLDYMEALGLERALHLDSDVLLYGSMDQLSCSYPVSLGSAGFCVPDQAHESLRWSASAHVGIFTVEALRRFCKFTTTTFIEKDWLSQYRYKWKHHGATRPGGICDMTTLYFFYRENPEAVVNLSRESNGAVFDQNFGCGERYQMRSGVKRVELGHGPPFIFRNDGRPVRALGLHFQGANKVQIPLYYQGPPFPGKTLCDFEAAGLRIKRQVHSATRKLMDR
jgi:hypothetical protein